MSLKLKPDLRVFVHNENVDLRAGFDKLSMLVREKINVPLENGDLFLFLGNNRKRLKMICYDGTGLLLIAKRMERGKFMRLEELEEREITAAELDGLLRGSIIRRAKFGSLPRNSSAISIDANARI
jgi:transposase